MKKLISLLSILITLIIQGCGSDSSPATENNNPNSGSINTEGKTLPYGLEKSNGTFAGGIGLFVFHSYQLAANRASIQSANITYDGNDNTSILYNRYGKPTCSIGMIDYVDTKPFLPIYANDTDKLKKLNNFEVFIDARNCLLEDELYDSTYSNEFITGNVSWSLNLSSSRHLITAEYANYTKLSNNLYQQVKDTKNILSITGESTYDSESINGKISSSFNDKYTSTNGFKLDVQYSYNGRKDNGITKVDTLTCKAKWNMLNPNYGTKFLDESMAKDFMGLGFHKVFAEGTYDLTIKVVEDMFFKPEGNGLFFASEGKVLVSLDSHNIQATIEYLEDGVSVIYTRNGKVTTTRLNHFGIIVK